MLRVGVCDVCGRRMMVGEVITSYSPLETNGELRSPPHICSRKGCRK